MFLDKHYIFIRYNLNMPIPGSIISYVVKKEFVQIDAENCSIRIYALSDDIIRVWFSQNKEFHDKKSYAIISKVRSSLHFVNEKEDFIEFSTNKVIVRVNKKNLSISFLDLNHNTIDSDFSIEWYPSKWEGYRIIHKKVLLKDDLFFGLGEKAYKLNRRRGRFMLWNTDTPGYKYGTDPIYSSIPFIIVFRNRIAYGLFFDNTFRSIFDLGHSSEEYFSFEAEGGDLDYYFIYGPTVKDVVKKYTSLTGRMPLPPIWSLGHQQSRYSYYPQNRVIDIAKRYRKEGIPLDSMYLDIHYMDKYKVFTWNRQRFPNPKKMIEELSKIGVKIIVIVDPCIKLDSEYEPFKEGVLNSYFCKSPNGELFVGRVWPGLSAFPDFTKEDVRKWWGNLHRVYIDAGVAGIWNDMNEPSVFNTVNRTMSEDSVHLEGSHAKVHNVYALLECKATYEGLLRLRPNIRPFVLTRAGFAGIQRYAAMWTGDNISSWDHLRLQIPMILSLGISGVPFVGADIGGFMRGFLTPELIVRWYQIASFLPLCRNHQALGSYDHEPWMFGERAKNIIKKFLTIRYKLILYLYTLFYEHYINGYPIARPLFFEFPSDNESYFVEDEFMVGPWLLIAPIVKEGAREREVYLPPGTWFDFWSNKKYNGSSWINLRAPLDKIPIFVREGAIVPMIPFMEYVGEKPLDPLYIHIYPSNNKSEYLVYEDDGNSLEYTNGKYRITRISHYGNTINVNTQGSYNPKRSSIVFVLHSAKGFKSILLNNEPLKEITNLEKVSEGYTTSEEGILLKVKSSRREFSLNLS